MIDSVTGAADQVKATMRHVRIIGVVLVLVLVLILVAVLVGTPRREADTDGNQTPDHG
jgi:hypothetical protein